ncbi:hypothetical protein LUZ61_020666 [Rhynchospora tenuis]|uniref:F-box domain-containing protein n=1 Tax=Rhynchospora tenuis TaxID=198213 RepID=A0AAD6EP20_9POAL|nr:hypothetical protein LUZ61_020666 [Rhynchospora tenuis]
MAEVDRISFLPEDIKISILSRLQVKDAFRTSALARSWRHVYTLLPSLRLGRFLDRLGDTSEDFYSRPISPSWIRRVRHVVSCLQGPFLIFRLTLELDIVPSNLLQTLLDLLFQKGGVQKLHLWFYYSFHPHKKVIFRLPPFHSLMELRLNGCQLVLPHEFRGFHCLTTLSISDVIISNHHLQLLLDTSKNLTTFLYYAQDLHLAPDLALNISLPLLTYVQFAINEMFDKICLVSTPRLEQADIFVTNYSVSEKLARVTLGLLTGASMVSSLYLDSKVLEAWSLLTLPFSFSFPQLKCLKLFLNLDTMDKRTCDVFHWLLKSMPFLEELNIKLFSSFEQTKDVASLMGKLFVKPNGVPCLDQTLKSVTVGTYFLLNVMTGITVVKFFLLNAKVLKLMKILYQDDELSIIEELQKAEVASSDAKVVVFNINTKVTVNVK